MHPDISFIFTAVCLQPRISLQMTDHPAGIHLESRCNCLRMKFSSRNCGKTSVCTLKYLITNKACTKSFRTIKFEIVGFRLRMSVRQISGPVTSVIQNFTQNHVGIWSDIMIKDCIYSSLCYISKFTNTGISPGCIFRSIQFCSKLCIIVSGLYQNLRIRFCFYACFCFCTYELPMDLL